MDQPVVSGPANKFSFKAWMRQWSPDWAKVVIKKLLYRGYKLSNAFYLLPAADKYDFQTIDIIRSSLSRNSNCIDVGAHAGHILMEIVKAAPAGKHLAFEPIPELYDSLKSKYKKTTTVHNYALSDKEGTATFNYYPSRPAVSGFRERNNLTDQKPVELTVKMERLDVLVQPDNKIDLLKIDVEGAEYFVLKGATELLKRDKPIVLFECGLGGADVYDSTPEQIFDLFTEAGMVVSTMDYFIIKRPPLSREEFSGQFYKGYNFFFVAYNPAIHTV